MMTEWNYNVFIQTSISFCQLCQKVRVTHDSSSFEPLERQLDRKLISANSAEYGIFHFADFNPGYLRLASCFISRTVEK